MSSSGRSRAPVIRAVTARPADRRGDGTVVGGSTAAAGHGRDAGRFPGRQAWCRARRRIDRPGSAQLPPLKRGLSNGDALLHAGRSPRWVGLHRFALHRSAFWDGLYRIGERPRRRARARPPVRRARRTDRGRRWRSSAGVESWAQSTWTHLGPDDPPRRAVHLGPSQNLPSRDNRVELVKKCSDSSSSSAHLLRVPLRFWSAVSREPRSAARAPRRRVRVTFAPVTHPDARTRRTFGPRRVVDSLRIAGTGCFGLARLCGARQRRCPPPRRSGAPSSRHRLGEPRGRALPASARSCPPPVDVGAVERRARHALAPGRLPTAS